MTRMLNDDKNNVEWFAGEECTEILKTHRDQITSRRQYENNIEEGKRGGLDHLFRPFYFLIV